MNLGRIVQQAREWLDDELEPYLHPQARLLRYGSDAQMEANLRARLLVDSTTAAVCTVPIAANQRTFAIHRSIIVVRRAEWQSSMPSAKPQPLDRSRFDVLDRTVHNWRTQTGEPRAIVQDLEQRVVTLDRAPIIAGTLNLTVWRHPLDAERIERASDEPVIQEEHHLPLAHWLVHMACLHNDAEARNPEKSAEHLAMFEAHFGPRPSLSDLKALATDHAGEIAGYFF